MTFVLMFSTHKKPTTQIITDSLFQCVPYGLRVRSLRTQSTKPTDWQGLAKLQILQFEGSGGAKIVFTDGQHLSPFFVKQLADVKIYFPCTTSLQPVYQLT